jgi:hypothetical protein
VGGNKDKKKPTGMAEASNNKQKRRKHTHKEERRGEKRERERMEGLRGARIFILFTFIPHPHLIRFVNILWTNFVASSIFCMPFDAKGGGEAKLCVG